jgi:lipid II:glycine glycyltransferase (peptidoglycan interpeptide bridge formation enzyme)
MQKAIREGVEVHHLQTRRADDVFYSLHCKTRRRHGLASSTGAVFSPSHSRDSSRKQDLDSSHWHDFEKQWIAGAVYFSIRLQAVYKFGASDPRFQHLRANNLLMWEGHSRGFENAGAPELSLGKERIGTTLAFLQFKRGWGGRERSLAVPSDCAPSAIRGSRTSRIRNLRSGSRSFPTRWSGACRYPSFDCWAESCTGTSD